MNAEETKAAAAVMLAWAEGKKVQFKYRDAEPQTSWTDIADPIWNFECSIYRIAPEPIEVDVWWHPDGRVLNDKVAAYSASDMIRYGYTLRRATIHPETK